MSSQDPRNPPDPDHEGRDDETEWLGEERGESDDATRALGGDDATQALGGDATQALGGAGRVYSYEHDPQAAGEQEPLAEEPVADEPGPADPEPRRGRDVAMAVIGALVGFILAFVIVALGTGEADGVDPAEVEAQIAALEAEVSALEDELEARDEQLDELAAERDEALEEAVEGADELEERQEALLERERDVEERTAELNEREAELDARAEELDAREAAIAEQEDGAPPPEADDENGELPLPDVDGEAAEGFVDRVLDGIRDLFGGD